MQADCTQTITETTDMTESKTESTADLLLWRHADAEDEYRLVHPERPPSG